MVKDYSRTQSLIKSFRKDSIVSVFALGTSSAFIISSIGLILSLGVQVLLARTMRAEGFGTYVYVLYWANVIVIFPKMGLDIVAVRYIPSYFASQSLGLLRGFLEWSSRIIALAGVFSAILVSSAVYFFGREMSEGLRWTFYAGSLFIPIMAFTALVQSALRGLKRVVLARLPIDILRPIILGVIVAILFFLNEKAINGLIAMTALVMSTAIILLVMCFCGRKGLPIALASARPEYRKREWLSTGAPLLLVSGLHLMENRFDTLMVGTIKGVSEAGVYSVAARLSLLVIMGLEAANVIVAPMISELFSKGDKEGLQKLCGFVTLAMIGFSFPMALGLTLAGDQVLAMFGEEFRVARLALSILTGSQLINALCGPVGNLLTMTGHHKKAAIVMVSSTLLNLGLNAILIPGFGIEGAALATGGSVVFWNLMMLYLCRRHLGVKAFQSEMIWKLMRNLLWKEP